MCTVLKNGFNLMKPICLCIQYPFIVLSSRSITVCFNLNQSDKLDSFKKEHDIKSLSENEDHTWVGPPHPVTNLRLKKFPTSKKLTKEEHYFYQKSREVQEWNQQYWELHNKDFVLSRKSYIAKLLKEKDLGPEHTITNEEMADFYKQFLNKNYKKHVTYNWQWYKRNFELIYLSAKAQLSRMAKNIKKESS